MKGKKGTPKAVQTLESHAILEDMRLLQAKVIEARKRQEDLNQQLVAINWEIDGYEKTYKQLTEKVHEALKKELAPPQAPVA